MLALTLALMLLLWSFNYIAGKIALRHMDPISLACFRIELAAIIMLPIYFSRKQRAALRLRDLWPFAYLGFWGVVVNQGLFTVGLNYTTSDHSAVIIAVGPIIILLLARIMKLEAVTRRKNTGNGGSIRRSFPAGGVERLAGALAVSGGRSDNALRDDGIRALHRVRQKSRGAIRRDSHEHI